MPAAKKKGKEPAEPQAPPTGCFHFANGDKYEGEYLTNDQGIILRHGHGVHSSSEGLVYDGDFENDAMSGSGRLSFPTGASYEGQFHDNQMHGRGIYSFPDGSSYEGEFSENKLLGRGQFTDTNGQKWVGEFMFRSAPGLRFQLQMDV